MHPGEQQIFDAYHAMADEAKYRPEIPGDIAGAIEIPEDELEADVEAAAYLERFKREERRASTSAFPTTRARSPWSTRSRRRA
jgi:hypothetical protein